MSDEIEKIESDLDKQRLKYKEEIRQEKIENMEMTLEFSKKESAMKADLQSLVDEKKHKLTHSIESYEKFLWIEVAAAYASASKPMDKRIMSEWANYACDKFRERFKK